MTSFKHIFEISLLPVGQSLWNVVKKNLNFIQFTIIQVITTHQKISLNGADWGVFCWENPLLGMVTTNQQHLGLNIGCGGKRPECEALNQPVCLKCWSRLEFYEFHAFYYISGWNDRMAYCFIRCNCFICLDVCFVYLYACLQTSTLLVTFV